MNLSNNYCFQLWLVKLFKFSTTNIVVVVFAKKTSKQHHYDITSRKGREGGGVLGAMH